MDIFHKVTQINAELLFASLFILWSKPNPLKLFLETDVVKNKHWTYLYALYSITWDRPMSSISVQSQNYVYLDFTESQGQFKEGAWTLLTLLADIFSENLNFSTKAQLQLLWNCQKLWFWIVCEICCLFFSNKRVNHKRVDSSITYFRFPQLKL